MNEAELTLSDSSHYLSICTPIKRRYSAKQDVRYHTKRPQIALFAILVAQDFRCNIIRCPYLFFQFLLGVKFLGGSKVDEFNLIEFLACFEQNIFWFEVSVHDVHVVAVRNCRQHLFHKNCGVFLREMPPLGDFIEQFTSLNVFLHYVKTLGVLIVLVNLDDVGVVNSFEDVYLVQHGCCFSFIHVLLFQNFHRSPFVSNAVGAEPDLTESALTKNFADLVLVS